jgi:hypothetical protein
MCNDNCFKEMIRKQAFVAFILKINHYHYFGILKQIQTIKISLRILSHF